jgi:hypothetical protein
MGYGNWARSPEEVQRQNGVRTDFEVAKQRYESIKPLQGKRKVLDVRPSGERDRAYERIVKVSDTEYYLTCTHWDWNDKEILTDAKNASNDERKPRAITFKQEGMVETITIHKNRWGFTSPSIYYFYEYNLPISMTMTKHGGSTYLGVKKSDDENLYNYNYYTLKKGDITFYRPKGATTWTPLVVHQEVRHKLDRKKTKAIREKLKTFVDYAKVMFPLVEPKGNSWGTVLDTHWADFVTLKNPDEIPESWLNAVAEYKRKLNRYSYETRSHEANEKGLIPKIQKEAYRIEKPFEVEVVPLGELSCDPYRGWL